MSAMISPFHVGFGEGFGEKDGRVCFPVAAAESGPPLDARPWVHAMGGRGGGVAVDAGGGCGGFNAGGGVNAGGGGADAWGGDGDAGRR